MVGFPTGVGRRVGNDYYVVAMKTNGDEKGGKNQSGGDPRRMFVQHISKKDE